MAKVQFHGNITGREDAKAVFNVMFNEFLAKGNTDNMHVIIEAWEQDGEVQVDAVLNPAGTNVPEKPIIFAFRTSDEEAMKFFLENDGKVIKVKHLNYLPNEGAVEVTL